MFILVLLPLLSIAAGFGVVAAIIFILLVLPLHRIIMYTFKRSGSIRPSMYSRLVFWIEDIMRGRLDSNHQSAARTGTAADDEPREVDLEVGVLEAPRTSNNGPAPMVLEDEGSREREAEAVFDV